MGYMNCQCPQNEFKIDMNLDRRLVDPNLKNLSIIQSKQQTGIKHVVLFFLPCKSLEQMSSAVHCCKIS